MRELRFRAWDGKDMLNIDHWTLSMLNQHVPENHIIEQFTGLFDKSGVEIYEGDEVRVIIKDEGHEDFIVQWDAERLRWGLRPLNKDLTNMITDTWAFTIHNSFEVISRNRRARNSFPKRNSKGQFTKGKSNA